MRAPSDSFVPLPSIVRCRRRATEKLGMSPIRPPSARELHLTSLEEPEMSNVHVVDHPLVQHKLTLMRDKTVSTKGFRQLLNEIGMLLAYEVTRDLPMEMVEVETPLAKTMQPTISGKKLVFAPILRAGVGFLDGMLNLVPSARVAHIGLYRDPGTLEIGRRLEIIFYRRAWVRIGAETD